MKMGVGGEPTLVQDFVPAMRVDAGRDEEAPVWASSFRQHLPRASLQRTAVNGLQQAKKLRKLRRPV